MNQVSSLAFRDQYEIRQGRIKLYRRTAQGTKYQSDSWYAAFKIPGQKVLRRSLKTSDQLEAEKFAEDQYYELLQKSQRGLSLTGKKFSLLADTYLRHFEHNVSTERSLPDHERRHKPARLKNVSLIIRKYLKPYFDDRLIQDITDFDIETYKKWRTEYWTSGDGTAIEAITYERNGRKVVRQKRAAERKAPSYNTVNKDLTVLRHIFEYARMNRVIEGRELPLFKNSRKPSNYSGRKPGLTYGEIQHLLATTVKRYHAEINSKHKRHLKLIIHYIAFMCLTGLRVSEAKSLHLSDCESIHKDGRDYLKIFVRAKGKSRELIGLEESGTTLEKLEVYHRENSSLHGWKVHPNLHVFVDQYGRSVNSFANSLNRAFRDAGLLYDKHGVKRSAGAFRKYYITAALLNNVDYFELAKQCGTSVGVIEQYYAEIETHQTPERFIFKNALTGIYDA